MQVGSGSAARVATADDPYEVGRERIREFAAALGADDPVHHDRAAARDRGHDDVIAPPTFLVSLTMRAEEQLAARVFGGVIDMADVLHREQGFEHVRPVRAGDRLVVSSDVTTTPSPDGRYVLRFRTGVGTEAGEPVCTATTVLVYSGPLVPA